MKGKLINQNGRAEVFEWGENGDKILKLFRYGTLTIKSKQEFNNTKQIGEVLPCVRPATEYVDIDGRRGIVYEKATGKTLAEKMSATPFTSIEKFAKMLALCHIGGVQQAGAGLKLLSVKEKLMAEITSVKELSSAHKKYLFDYISSLADGEVLCHFNFHPGNVVVDGSQAVITEWGDACLGYPLADVAKTCIILKYGVAQEDDEFIKFIDKHGEKIYEVYISEYLEITEVNPADIAPWELAVMAARLSENLLPDKKEKLLSDVIRILDEEMKRTDSDKGKSVFSRQI